MKKIVNLILILYITFACLIVKADSGFDASYGGSGPGGSDYFLPIDSDISNVAILEFIYSAAFLSLYFIFLEKVKKDNKISKKNYTIIFILIFLIFAYLFFGISYLLVALMFLGLALIVYLCINLDRKINNQAQNFKELSNSELIQKLGEKFNQEEFLKQVFKIYKDVQIAWMNNNLEDVKKVLSQKIYQNYKKKLKYFSKSKKNMMEDIEYVDAYITKIKKDKIVVILTVTCHDYIIDIKTNKVLKGKKENINKYIYKLVLKKDLNNYVLFDKEILKQSILNKKK